MNNADDPDNGPSARMPRAPSGAKPRRAWLGAKRARRKGIAVIVGVLAQRTSDSEHQGRERPIPVFRRCLRERLPFPTAELRCNRRRQFPSTPRCDAGKRPVSEIVAVRGHGPSFDRLIATQCVSSAQPARASTRGCKADPRWTAAFRSSGRKWTLLIAAAMATSLAAAPEAALWVIHSWRAIKRPGAANVASPM